MNQIVVTENGLLDSQQLTGRNRNTDHAIYEVIRLMDGIALFLEDHFERLLTSVQRSEFKFKMELSEFNQHIGELITANAQYNGNIKFLLYESANGNRWVFSFIPHSYPTDSDYRQGVSTALLFAERNNPNAKVVQQSVRQKADQLIAERRLYEVLLVDRYGHITEGSRSNVFFVSKGNFYTAPAFMILTGVTRKKVLECLHELKFKVMEEAVKSDEIAGFEAVFLTGTSPMVLPVKAIEDISFHVNNPLVEQLMEQYKRKIHEYLSLKKGGLK